MKKQVLVLFFSLTAFNLYPQTFTEQTGIVLTGIGKVEWGDYNNDGYLDILIGTKLYKNNGDNSFTEQIEISLTGGDLGCWGDYDSDGDLDILLAGSSSPKIYKNNGNNTFTEQTGIVLTGVSGGSGALGDYDNDGDLDILFTGYNGSIAISKIYRNNGNNIFKEQTGIMLPGVAGSVAWGDCDNDGDLDFLLSGTTGSAFVTKVYCNNGDNTFTDRTENTLPGVNGSISWADCDNDGDLDILLTGYGNSGVKVARLYRNNGSFTFTASSYLGTGVSNSSTTWGDYDNDGDQDVLLTGFNVSNQRISKIYRNNGYGSFTEMTAIVLPGVMSGSVAWGDYDNDNDLDILLTGASSTGYITKIYRNGITTSNLKPATPSDLQYSINDGIVTFSWQKPLDTETSQNGLNYNLYVYESGQTEYECPPHAFNQSDGKNGKRLIAKSGNIQWNPTGYKIKDLPPDKTYFWSVQAIDAGLQGSNFCSEQSFTLPLFKPVSQANCIVYGSVQAEEVVARWSNGGGERRAVFMKAGAAGTADPVDSITYNINDQTPDGWKCVYNGIADSVVLTGVNCIEGFIVHVCEYNGTVGKEKYLCSADYKNPAAYLFVEQSGIVFTGAGRSTWGDYNNDGWLDVLIGSKVYRNNSNNSFSEQTGIILSEDFYGTWGDYDNDGDLDILKGAVLYCNNGDNTFSELSGNEFAGGSSGEWGDYDNDGDLDILLISYLEGKFVCKIYRNNGDNSFSIQNGILSADGSTGVWCDYNNDGFVDILITGSSDNDISTIYRNNSGKSFTEQTNITLTGFSQGSAAWGDYDNDGDQDILMTGVNTVDPLNPISKIFRNNGDNRFTEQYNIILSGIFGSAAWGDYDNDGDLDILLSGRDSTSRLITKVYRNNADSTFSELNGITLLGIGGTGSWSDYDNDSDLDILISFTDPTGNQVSKIYRNELLNLNNKPSIPDGLQSFWDNDCIKFIWEKSSDNNIPTSVIRYNLRIGTSPGGIDAKSGQALPDGKLLLPAIFNLITDTCIKFRLPLKEYYWSVQAIDNGGLASNFAPEQVIPPDSVQANSLQAFIRSNNSMLIRWENGNGIRRALFCRYSSAIGIANPVNGKIYHAEPYFGNGDEIGTTGWYCMYNGKADSAIIYGIFEGYSYDIQVVEYCEINGLPIYLNTMGNGNPGVFSPSLFSEQSCTITGVVNSTSTWGDYDNDGDLDILLTGASSSDRISKIYSNDGTNNFIEQNDIMLAGVTGGYAAWGDYDNDDDLDILLTGSNDSNQRITKIYRNDSNNIFTDQAGIILPGLDYSFVAWGDYDNDGDLDILLTGSDGSNYISKICNNDAGVFTDSNAGLTGVYSGSSAWGDYDNDGDLDLLLTGKTGSNSISKIYLNNSSNSFIEQADIILKPVYNSSVGWGDYDNDGDLDILLAGSGTWIDSKIYRNNGNNTFTEQTEIILPNLDKGGTIVWGDYDNDGDLDILLAGWSGSIGDPYITKIYRNNGNNNFTEQTGIDLIGVFNGSVTWGDYDNDGDLDILLTGQDNFDETITKIYRNNIIMKAGSYEANKKPSSPADLKSVSKPEGLILSWQPVKSDETYFKAMSYNIIIGTSENLSDISSPQSNRTNGYRRIVSMGNAQLDTSHLVKNLPSGKYFWRVQAVDQGYAGGAWSAVDSFVVKNTQSFFKTDTICQGLPTHFTDQSVVTDGITSWKWDFRDGTISTVQNPVHTYSASGTYKVKLVVADPGGVKDSLEQDVIVRPKPLANFSAPSVCQGIPVTATNTTNNNGLTISSWQWDFGDGGTSTDQQPPPHPYLNAGDYNIKLKAIGSNGCADSVVLVATVGAYPVAAVTANAPLTFCKGDSVTLSVPYDADYLYNWKVDGTNLTDGDSSKYMAKLSGTYSVVVVNLKGNCTATSSAVAVTAKEAPVAPLISTSGDLIFCQGDSVVLSVTNTPGYAFQWKLNGGAVGTNSYNYSAKASGTYTLTVSNSSGCSVNSTNGINVTVNPGPALPTVSISGPTTFCEGGSVDLSVTNNTSYTYQWENNGATLTGATANTYKAQTPGIYSLKITNANQCYTETGKVTVNVLETPSAPVIIASKATGFCDGDSVELSVTNTLNHTYQWKLNDGATGSNSSKHTARNSGIYNLTVTNTNNCSVNSTNSVTVTVNPAPSAGNISLSGPAAFCQGGSVTMSVPASADYTYKWKNEYGEISGAETNSYIAVTSGIYRLEVTNTSGCKAETAPAAITVKPSPSKPAVAASNYTPGECPGKDPIILNAGTAVTGYNYTWIKDGEPRLNDTLTHLEFYEKGIYKLRAGLGDCMIESDPVTITLPDAPDKPKVYVKGPVVWYMAAESKTADRYQWYRNGELISGATKYIYVANKTLGTYRVAVGNQNNCYTLSDEKTIPLSKSEMTDFYIPPEYLPGEDRELENNTRLYPNPTAGVFTVEMENDITGEIEISIITEQGKEIRNLRSEKTTEHYNTEIDLSGEPKGIYIINLQFDKYTITRKIIIE